MGDWGGRGRGGAGGGAPWAGGGGVRRGSQAGVAGDPGEPACWLGGRRRRCGGESAPRTDPRAAGRDPLRPLALEPSSGLNRTGQGSAGLVMGFQPVTGLGKPSCPAGKENRRKTAPRSLSSCLTLNESPHLSGPPLLRCLFLSSCGKMLEAQRRVSSISKV